MDQERLILPTAEKKNVSLILYGPPGTGKTTYARALARALGWPLIIITPGNFIQRGESGIETAAQEIFESLLKTDRVIVLLDECDELFRRRDEQETGTRTILNFLTASMLPKLATLHDRGQLMFVIATNYLNQMEIAAIRGGRIDHQVAVPPPDASARRRLIRSEIEKAGIANRHRTALFTAAALGDAGRRTAGLTREEIKKAIDRFTRSLRTDRRGWRGLQVVRRFQESLDAGTKARLNKEDLLVEFYQHMRHHSEPVLNAGDRWRLPVEIVRAITRPGRP